MHNRHWLTSDWQQRYPSDGRITSSRRSARQLVVRLICGAALMALLLHLSACTTLPQQQCEMQKLPTQPALTEPLPLVDYSTQWAQLVESLRKKLVDTPATSKP